MAQVAAAVEREPVVSSEGEVLLEPLFWFKTKDSKYVCYGTRSLSQRLCERIEDLGFQLLRPGESWE